MPYQEGSVQTPGQHPQQLQSDHPCLVKCIHTDDTVAWCSAPQSATSSHNNPQGSGSRAGTCLSPVQPQTSALIHDV